MFLDFSKHRFAKNFYFKRFVAIVFFAVVLGILGFTKFAFAYDPSGLEQGVSMILGGLMACLMSLIGQLVVMVFGVLIWVTQYNNFINETVVSTGWVIVRDICNMFFILGLLVIAFGTVLKIEQYGYNKLLWKLLVMAVVINFSKMICGLLIDFSQVITLTFVSAFQMSAGGNLTQALGVSEMVAAGQNFNITTWQGLGAVTLGVIFLTITLVVVICMSFIFIFRIAYLWVLIILSPLAFVSSAVEIGGLKSVSQKWWPKFTHYLIVAPVLSFFLWLSLSTAAKTNGRIMRNIPAQLPSGESVSDLNYQGIRAGQWDFMVNFMVTIALLIVSMTVAQELGVAGGAAMKSLTTKGGWDRLGKKAETYGKRAIGAVGLGYRGGKGLFRGGRELLSLRNAEGRERMKERVTGAPERLGTAILGKYAKGVKEKSIAKEAKKAEGKIDKDLKYQATNLLSSQEKRIASQRELQKRGLLDEKTAKQMDKDLRMMPKAYEEFKSNLSAKDPDMARKVFYDGLATKQGVEKFKDDVKNKKFSKDSVGRMFEKMKEGDFDIMEEKGSLKMEDLGKFALENLDKEQLMVLNRKSKLFGKEIFDKIVKDDFLKKNKDGSLAKDDKGKTIYDHEKATAYAEVTGNLDQIDKDADYYNSLVLEQAKKKNVSEKAFKDEDVVGKINKGIEDKKLEAFQLKSLFETAVDDSRKNYMETQKRLFEKEKDNHYQSEDAQMIMKNVCETGGNIEELVDFKSEEGFNALEKALKGGKLKVENLGYSDPKKLGSKVASIMAKYAGGGELKKIASDNMDLAVKMAARGMDNKAIISSKLNQQWEFRTRLDEETKKIREKADEILKEEILKASKAGRYEGTPEDLEKMKEQARERAWQSEDV